MNRYTRQQQLAAFSGQAQKTLAAARVLIIGVGGLGSPLSTLLAGAGVGQLTLVDADTVSLSNLHRQTLYTQADIGKLKVDVAGQRLSSVNSDINITCIDSSLTIDNAQALIAEHTVVVDAADSFLVTYLLSDHCLKNRIPLVSASVLKTQGYLGVFCGTQDAVAPSYRAVFPSPPSNAANCVTAGVTGPSVGVMGSLQAQEVLKVIIGDASQLLAKVLYLDLWDYQQQIIDFSNAQEPEHSAGWVALSDVRSSDTLVDVRTSLELESEPLAIDSVNIPLDQLDDHFTNFEHSQSIVCVCKSGQRALNAAHKFSLHGFTNVKVSSQ